MCIANAKMRKAKEEMSHEFARRLTLATSGILSLRFSDLGLGTLVYYLEKPMMSLMCSALIIW